jgi:hypothetical protein
MKLPKLSAGIYRGLSSETIYVSLTNQGTICPADIGGGGTENPNKKCVVETGSSNPMKDKCKWEWECAPNEYCCIKNQDNYNCTATTYCSSDFRCP